MSGHVTDASFTVTPLNDAQTLAGDAAVAVVEGGAVRLTTAQLTAGEVAFVQDGSEGLPPSISRSATTTARVPVRPAR